jgi:hypothetical protein
MIPVNKLAIINIESAINCIGSLADRAPNLFEAIHHLEKAMDVLRRTLSEGKDDQANP